MRRPEVGRERPTCPALGSRSAVTLRRWTGAAAALLLPIPLRLVLAALPKSALPVLHAVQRVVALASPCATTSRPHLLPDRAGAAPPGRRMRRRWSERKI